MSVLIKVVKFEDIKKCHLLYVCKTKNMYCVLYHTLRNNMQNFNKFLLIQQIALHKSLLHCLFFMKSKVTCQEKKTTKSN